MRGRKKIVLKKIELDSVPAVDFFGEGGSQGGGSVTALGEEIQSFFFAEGSARFCNQP